MAQGHIRIRCRACRKTGSAEKECKSHKYPDRVYNALYTTPGGAQESATVATKSEAEIFLAEARLKYHKNPQLLKPESKTFDQVADEYIALKKASPLVDIKTSTLYETVVNLHIKPFFKNLPVSTIQPDHAEKCLADAQRYSKYMQQKVNFHMNAIFKRAALQRLITQSPAENIDRPKLNADPEYNILEPEEIKTFFTMLEDDLFLKIYIKLAIFTGMRAGEVCGLRRDSISFENKEIEIKQVVKWYTKKERADIDHNKPWKIVKRPKTPAGFRKLPISNELIKDLQIFLIEQRDNPNNLLFANQFGDPVRHSNFFKLHVKPAIKKAGLTAKYHELRHTFCALMCAQIGKGTDLGLVKYYMGHEKSDVTLDIYNKVLEQNKRAGSKIADTLEHSIFGEKAVRVNAVSMNQPN